MRNYENERELTRALLDFLEKSPTSFHAVEQMEARLRKEGFEELREEDSWKLEEGGKYYVIRSMSSLIAFRIPGTDFTFRTLIGASPPREKSLSKLP